MIANARAIGALTKHLGFRHVANLELRFGRISGGFMGRRVFSDKDLVWRARSPLHKTRFVRLGNGEAGVAVFPFGPFFPIIAKVPIIQDEEVSKSLIGIFFKFGFTLDWNKEIKPIVFLPKFLKPSPLAFVFRPLKENAYENLFAWTFPDFDAF